MLPEIEWNMDNRAEAFLALITILISEDSLGLSLVNRGCTVMQEHWNSVLKDFSLFEFSIPPPLPFNSSSPLQFVDLFLLVILFILHLPQDLQQPLHLALGLPSILFVPGHFLLQAGDALGEFSATLWLRRWTLRLEKKFNIKNKPSVLAFKTRWPTTWWRQ